MTGRHRRLTCAMVVALLAGVGLAGCGGGGNNSGSSRGAKPHKGGTLEYVGKADVDHLDYVSAYGIRSFALERAFTRQLVVVPSTKDINKAGKIAPDVATQVPTKANGGISKDGLTYTFHLKKGVKWNAPSGARQVTAKDFARGFERLCNPVMPSGGITYYTGTIKGMSQFCGGFHKVKSTPSAIADYIKSHDISGVKVKDDMTLRITLKHPTPDFLSMMALPFMSAAPKEYLKYKPDGAKFRHNTISDGPYQIANYQPNKQIVLKRNPAWERSTDDVRHAYVNKIVVTEGVNAQSAFQQIMAGTADLEWDQTPPTAKIPQLLQTKDRRFEYFRSGTLFPYIVFNLVRGPAKKLKVRQAVAYAVNKRAVAQVFGGPKLNIKACQILPPSSDAHQNFCPYPSKNGEGNVKKAKRLLKEAGYPDGLTLKMVYQNTGTRREVAETLQGNLKRAGITLDLHPLHERAWAYMESSSTAKREVWDISTPGWVPDWFGNNARTYLQPLFDSSAYSKSDSTWGFNFGYYHNQKVNSLIRRATTAGSEQQANQLWHEAEVQILKDAAIAPILWQKSYTLHSKRLHNFLPYPFTNPGDPTNMWLSNG
ncbi:MAG: ABC transporter substrate-binding protein [Nocardioidaceae bacterium]